MTKGEQILEFISGYANGLITDDECSYQTDLIEDQISIIDGMVYSHEIDEWVPKEEYLKNN